MIQFIFTLKSVPEVSVWPHAPPISRQQFPVFLGVLSHLPSLGNFRVNSLELLFCSQCPRPSRSAQCHQLPSPITYQVCCSRNCSQEEVRGPSVPPEASLIKPPQPLSRGPSLIPSVTGANHGHPVPSARHVHLKHHLHPPFPISCTILGSQLPRVKFKLNLEFKDSRTFMRQFASPAHPSPQP